jgi:hypothetical protein
MSSCSLKRVRSQGSLSPVSALAQKLWITSFDSKDDQNSHVGSHLNISCESMQFVGIQILLSVRRFPLNYVKLEKYESDLYPPLPDTSFLLKLSQSYFLMNNVQTHPDCSPVAVLCNAGFYD